MAVMGPNLTYYIEEGKKFADILIQEHLCIAESLKNEFPESDFHNRNPFNWYQLAFRVHQQVFPTNKSIDVYTRATWCAAFWVARPEGSFETFRAYLIKMFEMQGCWDF